jgi:hypothetical protein
MDENAESTGTTVPTVHPVTPDETPHRRLGPWRRTLQVGVALGLAAGVAVGATALASAATSGSNPPSSSSSGSAKGTPPKAGHRMFGFGGGGFGGGAFGFGAGVGGYGPVLHAVETVKGPNGYETLQIQNGTVTSLKDVSGSTWTLVVTSADKTALTYTVNSGSSVNGGETGISSVASGDSVNVLATVSSGTATVKSLIDTTKLQANRSAWAPKPATAPQGSSSGFFAPPAAGGPGGSTN